jgi:hypothetical protein
MRGLKSTLALLVVLVGLGAYIYFVASKPDDSATSSEKVFASVEASSIEELKIKSDAGEVTTVKKDGAAWKIVDPVSAPASDTEISSITSALSSLEIARVVEENAADLKDFGLDAPRIEVEFKSGGGKPSGRLFLGAKTPTGGNVYARKDDEKRVLLVAQYQESTFNKSTFDLRDKAIVKFERDTVDGVDVSVEGSALEFAKAGTDWKMVKPLAARADFSAVDGLVSRVQSAQMKSFVGSNPTPADLKKYGLDKPAVTVNVHLGSARATLAVGGKADDNSVYARDASKPDIVTIESSLADDLGKSADDYRRKDVFEFRAFNATRVEITRSGQTTVFERVKSEKPEQPDSWKRVSPNPGDPDRQKVESFLAGLADVRATSFVASTAKTGLDAPAMTVLAKFDEGKKEERVTFGKSGSDVYVLRPDEPGAAKIESDKFDEAIKALDEISK